MTATISELIHHGDPSALAIAAPAGPPVTFAGLTATVDRLAGQFRALGLTRHDTVGLVLPNGPEMAAAFLATAGCATAAPLNPAYRTSEFRYYLEDLDAKAVITTGEEDGEVAGALSSETRRLELIGEGTDLTLAQAGRPVPWKEPVWAGADDTALVLHTSGTTARPKIVPLSHRNLTTSAHNIVSSLQLAEGDRCLNVMPLFHIHGLVASLLSSLLAGASVVCTPGFQPLRFLRWLEDVDPTWFSAVPTMHQVILSRLERSEHATPGRSLRFIRSSSAPLAPAVMNQVEAAFGVPMLEAYGMTEASHQIATNPLPPDARQPGSVGKGSGVEVGLMNPEGELLPSGKAGEVVIRGANVTAGYRDNDEANRRSFVDGWFRTGDEGILDNNEYLRLTGRIKEMINRGGEKVSPREIDEVLLDHPGVRQAVAFAMPDKWLGEEVAAAVILEPAAELTEQELRRFAAERLAQFKVPRTIIFVESIPKGPTGKLRRIGLADQLGLT